MTREEEEKETIVELIHMKEEPRHREISGEKTLKLQLRCIHPSDLTHTDQCSQLGCFDWQQLHWPQMEIELQCYPPSLLFLQDYVSSVNLCVCVLVSITLC